MSEWKKRKDIKGVSSSTIVDLKAVLYQAEQDSKRQKVPGQKLPKPIVGKKTEELLSANKGVLERAKRDEQAKLEEEYGQSWEAAQEKLKAKSQLYDKLVRGEIMQSYDDDDDRNYLVDFDRRNYELDTDPSKVSMMTSDMRMEQERRDWEKESELEMIEEAKRRDRIRLANSVEEQTKQGRKKHLELKLKRKMELEHRLKQIKKRTGGQADDTTQTDNKNQTNSTETTEDVQNVDDQIEELFKSIRSKHEDQT